ncbi:hypothetical protein [Xanthobacter flavus]|uniref:hypothetical protein n=1 Tax=Xanthobacter flavus TaxID=281 RepID=UPI00372B7F1D
MYSIVSLIEALQRAIGTVEGNMRSLLEEREEARAALESCSVPEDLDALRLSLERAEDRLAIQQGSRADLVSRLEETRSRAQ